MFDGIMTALGDLMSSPWVYLIIALISLIDAVVPLFPSEAPLIMAGVYAGSTAKPMLAVVVLVAALGASTGDHIAYFIGRAAAGPLERIPANTRRGRALGAAKRMLQSRGGMALVIGRFIPWGRVATTIVFGAMRFPRRRFTLFDLIGCSVWALHGTLMGYIGGAAFQNQPEKGLLLGLAMAIAASALMELVRWWWQRRRAARVSAQPVDGDRPAAMDRVGQ
ncbi:DedA family protein [Calidifontibacter terrae]